MSSNPRSMNYRDPDAADKKNERNVANITKALEGEVDEQDFARREAAKSSIQKGDK